MSEDSVCITSRCNFVVEGIYIGPLLSCIIRIDMLVNPHNEAILSFRRTFARAMVPE